MLWLWEVIFIFTNSPGLQLSESNITVEVKDETQLDVFIDDLGRKIRLNVKPDSKKGSGGGSEATPFATS